MDPRALALVTGGDRALAREAFARFFEANEEDVAALDQGVAAGDAAAILRAAHRIKGASRTLGAMPLGEVSAAIEQCARDADLAGVQAQLPRLRAELARLEAWRRGAGG